nr:phage protease [Pseudomonas aeruginosa]
MIEDGEYLYFSPVFSYAPDGTVLSILMGAITNDPPSMAWSRSPASGGHLWPLPHQEETSWMNS